MSQNCTIPTILINFLSTMPQIGSKHINYRNHLDFRSNNIKTSQNDASTARRFMPTETKTMHILMSRLAARALPPSGFWAETQNRENNTVREWVHAIRFIQ